MNEQASAHRLSYWLKLLALPISVVAIIASLYLARSMFPLPTDDELREIARNLFARYGIALVFIGGLLEGVIVLGWYFPGTTVILFCLLFAAGDPAAMTAMAASASAGLSLAYIGNYAIGRFGWYRLLLFAGLGEPLERARARLARHGLAFLLLSYWQFTLASLSSTAAGILRLSFVWFLMISTFAATFWVGFWSALIYLLGERAVSLVGLPFIFTVFLGWILLSLAAKFIRARSKKSGT